jgi:hypothetical protein
MRNTFQKWMEYENYIDDLMRDYSLNKSHLSTHEKASIVNTIMKTEDAIFRLKQTFPKVIRRKPANEK